MKTDKTTLILGAVALALIISWASPDFSLLAAIGKKSKTAKAKVSVEVKNQKLIRGMLKIKKVTVDRPAFVVVHKPEDIQNIHGISVCRPIGASNLITGRADNVSVGVGGGNISGRLKVMIHYDTNNNGQFDDGVDLPVQENGAPMTREMRISP